MVPLDGGAVQVWHSESAAESVSAVAVADSERKMFGHDDYWPDRRRALRLATC